MHDNLFRTKNEESPGLLAHAGRSDEDDLQGEIVLTAYRENTIVDNPECCEEQVQPTVVFTTSSSASGLESTNSTSPLELQVDGGAVGYNTMSWSIEAGEHVENWSSSWV